MFVGETRDVPRDIAQRVAAHDGHAVVRLLAEHRAVLVARGLQHLERELVVAELELLQAENIDRIGGGPVQDMRKPRRQRIDIPGGKFHELTRGLIQYLAGNAKKPEGEWP